MGLFPGFPRVLILVYAQFSHSGFYRLPVGLKQGSFRRETGSCERKDVSGFVSSAFCTSNSPAFCPFTQLVTVCCLQTIFSAGGRYQLAEGQTCFHRAISLSPQLSPYPVPSPHLGVSPHPGSGRGERGTESCAMSTAGFKGELAGSNQR